MKRKISYFEKKLRELSEDVEDYDPNTLEGFLIAEIKNGKMETKKCTKGRKRNYNQFFEKNLLKRFIIDKMEKNDEPSITIE